MSTWNAISGNWSWEERDFSKVGSQTMRELLEQQTVFDGTVTVGKCDGDVNVLVLHGKKRLGFDFEELKFDFKITSPTPAEGSAVCELDSALPDDWEFNVTVKTGDKAQTKKLIEELVRSCLKQLEEKIIEKI